MIWKGFCDKKIQKANTTADENITQNFMDTFYAPTCRIFGCTGILLRRHKKRKSFPRKTAVE